MRTLAPIAYGLVLLALLLTVSATAVATPSLRIFGFGKPSMFQRSKYAYMLNGRKAARSTRRSVVVKTVK
jgi:hypothetical protein